MNKFLRLNTQEMNASNKCNAHVGSELDQKTFGLLIRPLRGISFEICREIRSLL